MHRVLEAMLEFAQRIVFACRCVDEEAGVARGMRHERHDRDERQRRMESAPEQRGPRQGAAGGHVRPEDARLPSSDHEGGGKRSRHEQRRRDHVNVPDRVEQREDDEAKRIVGDREEQQEWNGWMVAENHFRDEIAEGDVGGAGNRPAANERAMTGRERESREDGGGRGHAANRGDDRQRRPAPRMQRAARTRGLDDLLRSQREEEHHADVVDGKIERTRERRVARRRCIRPDERDCHTRGQHERMVDGEPTGAPRGRRDRRARAHWLGRHYNPLRVHQTRVPRRPRRRLGDRRASRPRRATSTPDNVSIA